MQEAAEDPDCRYWQLAGRGNFISDEAAVSMAAVEFSLELPPPSPAAAPPIGQLLPPYQQWLEADFSANQLRLYDAGNRQEMVPQVVHFANCGKNDPAYQRWIEQVVTRQPFSDTGGEKCCYRNQQ